MDAKEKKSSGPIEASLTQWVREHVETLGWALPTTMVLLVVGYELGPARWIYETLGYRYHLLAEIIIFASLGPTLAFIVLQLLRRWLEERETSDLQAHLLARSRAEAEGSRQLNDDALQELTAQVEQTEDALQDAVGQLRSHLLKAQE
jgi:hypothetical protein